MAMFDPATGKWYNYDPGSPGEYNDESGNPVGARPPSLNPVDAPADAPGGISDWVDPTGGDPQALAAQLLRAQFAEWEKSFKPVELNAMKQLSFNNPEVVGEAVDKARGAVSGQFGTMRGVLERGNAALGIAPTEQQKTVSDRIMNLNEATSVANAENTARANIRAQDEQILLGATPNRNIVKGIQ